MGGCLCFVLVTSLPGNMHGYALLIACYQLFFVIPLDSFLVFSLSVFIGF